MAVNISDKQFEYFLNKQQAVFTLLAILGTVNAASIRQTGLTAAIRIPVYMTHRYDRTLSA